MTTTTSIRTREACLEADETDSLRDLRDRFELPEEVIYLDGNSLGARPRTATARASEIIEKEWGEGLIRSWNNAGWFDLPSRLGDKLSTLLGARPSSIVVTDSTSLNLFKALAAALRIQSADNPSRRVVVAERDSFPTDLYISQGLIDLLDRGYELRLIDDELSLEDAVGDDTAAVVLSHANYRTGTLWDMADVTSLVHARGAVVIWDLCHTAGAVPIELDAADPDFAIGCTYKYLNGGPGSPAFIWVAERHRDRYWQPLSGWWGHANPFAMDQDYAPDQGIRRFLCGTQGMVSMALVECGLDITLSVDQLELRQKSLALTNLFIDLVEERCADHPLTLVTPREEARRGSHVSFRHPEGYAVMAALIARGVIGDYREPEVLRFGITPLYLGYTDVWDAVEVLREVLDTRSWDREEFHRRAAVT